jgi:hypothetical protein
MRLKAKSRQEKLAEGFVRHSSRLELDRPQESFASAIGARNGKKQRNAFLGLNEQVVSLLFQVILKKNVIFAQLFGRFRGCV